MKRKIIKFLKTDLFKASFLNGIANIIKILTSIVSNKIVAVYLGPSGIALLGQFQNFIAMVMSLANVGINSGITKYVAEYHDDELKRKKVVSTGFYIIIAGSLVASIVVFFGRYYFSDSILKTREYVSVFIVFAATLFLFVLNSYMVSVLNGFKEFKKIIITNILSSLFSLLIAVVLVINYGVYGAFLGWILSQTLVFFVTFFWVFRLDWFSWGYFTKYFDKSFISNLSKYSLMAVTSIFTVIFIQLQIRTYIINHISIEDAGYWQGVIRICDLYITFVTTTLGIYYLPRLSELKTNEELRKEIFQGYKFILPLVIFSSLVIYVLKDFIIDLLFSHSFRPMSKLFLFQLIGNVFKMASWLLGYLMVAKAYTKIYISTEIIFGLSYFGFNIIFIKYFGVVGTTYAYCLNYLLYLIAMVFIFNKLLFVRNK